MGTHSCIGLALHSGSVPQVGRPSIAERACRGSGRGRCRARSDPVRRQGGSQCLRIRKSGRSAPETGDRVFSERSRPHRPDRLACPESPAPRRARPCPCRRRCPDVPGRNGEESPGFAVGRAQASRRASGTGANARERSPRHFARVGAPGKIPFLATPVKTHPEVGPSRRSSRPCGRARATTCRPYRFVFQVFGTIRPRESDESMR